jgi:hypothetical protein
MEKNRRSYLLGKGDRTIEDLREEQYAPIWKRSPKKRSRILGDLISFNKSTETAD